MRRTSDRDEFGPDGYHLGEPMLNDDDLFELGELLGVTREYLGFDQVRRVTSPSVVRTFIESMGREANSAELDRARRSRWASGVPLTAVARPGVPGIVPWTVPYRDLETPTPWMVVTEDCTRIEGVLRAGECPKIESGLYDERRAFPLPELPVGYHRLELSGTTCLVICAPERSHRPSVLEERRVWGVAVQLYALRSERNWGMGDFADLELLIRYLAGLGADFVGLNPLHALFANNPAHCSPYSPSTRRWLNPLYIAVDRVPEVVANDSIQAELGDAGFVQHLAGLRASELVDYPAVAAVKDPILRAAFDAFEQTRGQRHVAFERWMDTQGDELTTFTAWETLQLVFGGRGVHGFSRWPLAYRDPSSPEVASLLAEHKDLQRYRAYLQWVAAEQLATTASVARDVGMSIGLYTDIAVGAEGEGAERWASRELFGRNASIGAPPDAFNLKGQDWGMPPLVPDVIRGDGYTSFRAALESAMTHSGAIRIDHVMALRRLYWVPAGAGPAEGAYVLYPFDDMLAVLTLESHRRRCLVVGEDLGVVPPEVTQALRGSGSFSYRIFFFEQADGGFKTPSEYLRESLTVASTHDLPTLSGFWSGRDIEVRDQLDLWPDDEVRTGFVGDRNIQRGHLLAALQKEGLISDKLHPEEIETLPQDIMDAIHFFIARGENELMALQLEDVVGQLDQINVPGTVDAHPNWRRKLPISIESLSASEDRSRFFQRLNAERRGV
ncbi:MAG: 4-alpha-glucanotransferase [Myxococcota bacterium]